LKIKASPLITQNEDPKRLNEYIEIFLNETRDVVNTGMVLGENTRGKMFDVHFPRGSEEIIFNHDLGFIPRGAFLVNAEPDPPYAVRYALAGTQVITNNSPTIIEYDTLVSDERGDVTTGSGFKYEPNAPGYYQVNAQCSFQPTTSTGSLQLFIYVNGSASSSTFEYKASATSFSHNSNISDIVYLPDAKSRIQILVLQNKGGDRTLGNGVGFNWMSIHALGRDNNMVISSKDETTTTMGLTSNVSGNAKLYIF
jgi:hypothetical protein